MSAPLKRKRHWSNKPKKWTTQEIALAERLHQQGRTYAQIACNFGVSKSAIASMFRNYGIAHIDESQAGTKWRIKQLLSAGYTPSHIAEWIGVPLSLAMTVFDEWADDQP